MVKHWHLAAMGGWNYDLLIGQVRLGQSLPSHSYSLASELVRFRQAQVIQALWDTDLTFSSLIHQREKVWESRLIP